jgi:hypothetical protein
VTGRHVATARIAVVFAVDAEVHLIAIIIVVENYFFEPIVVEIVFWNGVRASRFASRPTATSATTSRLAFLTGATLLTRSALLAGLARCSRFAWYVVALLILLGRLLFTLWLTFRASTATTASTTASASATRFAVFVRCLFAAVFCFARFREFNLDGLAAPRFADLFNRVRFALRRTGRGPTTAPAVSVFAWSLFSGPFAFEGSRRFFAGRAFRDPFRLLVR